MKKIFLTLMCLFTMNLTANAEICTMVRASHILVKTKAEAVYLKTLLDKGASFGALAEQFSLCPSGRNGGDLNFFHRGQMVKPFSDAAFQLKKGEISEPIQTEFGWHLIKVTGRICEP